MLVAIALSALMETCNAAAQVSDVNRPIAVAQVAGARTFESVRETVAKFADQSHFALQPIISQPRGPVVFSMRLFRDDISIILTRPRGEPIQITAYPLCACELGRRVGLQEAADSSVAELRTRLSR